MRALIISLALLVFLMIMLVLEYVPRSARFEVGKPSMETTISARDFSVIDEEATEKTREAERQRIKNLFIDPNAQAAAVSNLGDFFNRANILSAGEGSLEGKIEELKVNGGLGIDEHTLETVVVSSEERARVLYTTAVELLTLAMSNHVSYDNLNDVRDEISTQAEQLRLEGETRAVATELAAAFTRMVLLH